MIEVAALENIWATASDMSVCCEIYHQDTVPTAEGFDPADALACFAAVDGIVFFGQTYQPLVEKFGGIKRTVTQEINSASVTFSNVSRLISTFEFTYGFEGLIMVIRLLSRSKSIALADTQILFAGRCEKPSSGDKSSLTVQAKFILGSMDVRVPRRKFGRDDPKGRVVTDPEFEGFRFVPQYGTVSYARRQRRGGILGWFGFKKTVRYTLPWSSYSDVDGKKPVPEVFGQSQIMAVLIGAADVGTFIQIRSAFCEGPIQDIVNCRSTDQQLPLSAADYAEILGLVGIANGPDNVAWVAPGYYSRTAHVRAKASNSLVDVNDPAPDVVAVIVGRILTTPNPATGVWDTQAWTDNAAAITRYLLTSDDYYKLDANWIDDDYALKCFNYNADFIFNTSVSDFLFVEQG